MHIFIFFVKMRIAQHVSGALMSKTKPTRKTAFKREALVKTLKAQGNHRWREAACRDLRDLQKHNGGVDHLAAAIKAILRSDKWSKNKD